MSAPKCAEFEFNVRFDIVSEISPSSSSSSCSLEREEEEEEEEESMQFKKRNPPFPASALQPHDSATTDCKASFPAGEREKEINPPITELLLRHSVKVQTERVREMPVKGVE